MVMRKLGLGVGMATVVVLAGCSHATGTDEAQVTGAPSVSAARSTSGAPSSGPSTAPVTGSSVAPAPSSAALPPAPVPSSTAATGPDQLCPPVNGLQMLTRGVGGRGAASCAEASAVLKQYAGTGTQTVQGWQCVPVGTRSIDVAVTRCSKGPLTVSTYSTRNVSPATAAADKTFLDQLRADGLPLVINVQSPAANDVTAALGHQVCGEFGMGVDYEKIADGISAAFAYNPDDARTVITASVLTLCPQYKKLVGG